MPFDFLILGVVTGVCNWPFALIVSFLTWSILVTFSILIKHLVSVVTI